jgi:hypothetical protein
MTRRLDPKRILLGALVLSMVAAVPTACTFIGAGIGAAASPRRDEQRLPGYETQRIPIGTDVVVQMHSGEIVRGTYAGPLRDPYGRPVPNLIVLDRPPVRRSLRIEEIYSVSVPGRTSGTWVGAAVGLAVDVLVIAAVVSAMPDRDKKPKTETDGGWGSGSFSCPLVFGFDGQSYRLEAEVFGGALFPSMPRTDWARLDHAAEHAGQLRLKIAGQPGETQFLDELALVTVDHAAGAEVLPSRGGRFLLVADPKPAIRARGFGGRDVLESGRAAFERLLEQSPELRAATHSAMVREGMLLVKIFEDGAWRRVDHVWEVGPGRRARGRGPARARARAGQPGEGPAGVLRWSVARGSGQNGAWVRCAPSPDRSFQPARCWTRADKNTRRRSPGPGSRGLLVPRLRVRLHVTSSRGESMSESTRARSSRDKVRAHRARLRRQGLRPIQIWVPDVRSRSFKTQAHRQSVAVASSRHADDDQAFIDAVSEWSDG